MRARERIHQPGHIGDAIADKVTTHLGSWHFIIIQSAVLALWIILNSVGWAYHWDSYPYILCNLCLSFQAAFTGPIVLLSQNRQAEKDRKRDSLEAAEVDELYQINKVQLDILHQQSEILNILHGKGGVAVVKEVGTDEQS